MSDGDAAAAGRLRILLLEDSAFDRELLLAELESSCPPASVAWVADEAGFSAALRSGEPFDLILSDYQLPGFSGDEALAQALQAAPDTPFIFVSGVIGEENTVELLKKGATDYVIKGRLERLPIVIERALREVRQKAARQLAQSQLREADALYARVVDSLRDYAVLLLDREGRIRQWNRAAGLVFGHPLAEFAGRHADSLCTPEDRASGVLPADLSAALSQGAARGEQWMLRGDGARIRVEKVVTPVHNDAGAHTGFSMILRDVTAAYEASRQLLAAKEEAERSNELKDQFLAVLSHELRSPLSAISGWADILEKRSGQDPLVTKAALVIRRNAQLQTRMINDLLDMSAVVAGKLALQPAPLDLAELAAESLLSHSHAAQARGVALESLAGDGPLPVRGDAQRLAQVIANLVGNALKFTEPGGRVEVRAWAEGGQAVLRVSDSGCGISPGFLPHVFDRLRQEDGTITRRAGGLGLGLAISRAIVELHGGLIHASSEGPGRGAVFEVRLPLGEAGPAARPEAAGGPAAASRPSAGLRGLRVLLVDDEEDARDVGQACLEGLGATVRAAVDAPSALALLSHGAEVFDVIVSDIGMPQMDGLSLIRAVRRLPDPARAGLPAVALSAFAMRRDEQAGLAAGFQAYVAKPIQVDALAEAIHAAVDGRERPPGAAPSGHPA